MEQLQYDQNGWVVALSKPNFIESSEYMIKEISNEEFNNICNCPEGYRWRIINNNQYELQPYDLELLQQRFLENLRFIRKNLLQAFDIYKINVFYGIESDINHDAIIHWYHLILDLNEEAINNPPQEITRYIS